MEWHVVNSGQQVDLAQHLSLVFGPLRTTATTKCEGLDMLAKEGIVF